MKQINKDFFVFPISISFISLAFYFLFYYLFEPNLEIDRLILFDENSRELMNLPAIFVFTPISVVWDSFFFFIFMLIISSLANASLSINQKSCYKLLDSDPEISILPGIMFGVSVGFFLGFSDEFLLGFIIFLIINFFSIAFFEYGFILGAISAFGLGLGFGLNFGIGFLCSIFTFFIFALALLFLLAVERAKTGISKLVYILLNFVNNKEA